MADSPSLDILGDVSNPAMNAAYELFLLTMMKKNQTEEIEQNQRIICPEKSTETMTQKNRQPESIASSYTKTMPLEVIQSNDNINNNEQNQNQNVISSDGEEEDVGEGTMTFMRQKKRRYRPIASIYEGTNVWQSSISAKSPKRETRTNLYEDECGKEPMNFSSALEGKDI